MVAVPENLENAASAVKRVPVTIEAWAADPPGDFSWPAPFPGTIQPMADFYQRYVDEVIAESDADVRNILLMGRRPMQLLALIQFALWCDAARKRGERMVGDDILDYLSGASREMPPALQVMPLAKGRARLVGLRRILRTASWTTAWRLPRAMLAPDGVALTHNSLLRTYLRHSPDAVRNAYDEDFPLKNLTRDKSFARGVDALELAGRMAGALVRDLLLDGDIKARLADTMRAVLSESYRDAMEVTGRLRAARNLPRKLVTGTGGKRISRALGLEIMRRGGEVTRCDHGGSFLLLHHPHYMALNELSVSTRFVVATPLAAESSDAAAGCERARPLADCVIAGSRGDPGLDVGAGALTRSVPATGKRRAMYVPSIFYGLNQASPPVPPGSLYLAWQRRLVAALQGISGVELIWKPHPSGHKPPAHLDPARDIKTLSAPFEQAVAEADLLIYDFPATTTLAVGLCTDRPIVLVDHGNMRFNPWLRHEVEARCSFVVCGYDEHNLPTVSRDELEDAICDSPPSADPTFFRSLFLGDT